MSDRKRGRQLGQRIDSHVLSGTIGVESAKDGDTTGSGNGAAGIVRIDEAEAPPRGKQISG